MTTDVNVYVVVEQSSNINIILIPRPRNPQPIFQHHSGNVGPAGHADLLDRAVRMRGRRAPGARGPCAPGAWASLGAAGAARHPRALRPLGSPPGPPRPGSAGGRRAVRVRAGAGEDEAAYDPLAFGKAGSHKDVWEGYAQGARADFLASLDDPDSDPVRILLYLAQEHDAVSSRAVVNLPVDSYSRRLDKLVSGCVRALEGAGLQDSEDKQAILDCCTRHLFETERYKVAASEGEQTSPYRTYSAWLLAGGKAGVGSGLGLRGEQQAAD